MIDAVHGRNIEGALEQQMKLITHAKKVLNSEQVSTSHDHALQMKFRMKHTTTRS